MVKRSKERHSHSAKRERKSETEDPNEHWMDLTMNLQPLSSFVSDRHKLISEAFEILGCDKVKSMLPEVMQSYSVNELKEMFVNEANTLSNDELTKIITSRNDSTKGSAVASDIEKQTDDPTPTQMELLELELRARAIKSLMRFQELNDAKSVLETQLASIQSKSAPVEADLEDEYYCSNKNLKSVTSANESLKTRKRSTSSSPEKSLYKDISDSDDYEHGSEDGEVKSNIPVREV